MFYKNKDDNNVFISNQKREDAIEISKEEYDILVKENNDKAEIDKQYSLISYYIKDENDTWNININLFKEYKIKEIKESFYNTLSNGTFISKSLGIEIDARRNEYCNDLQNLQSYINYLKRNNLTSGKYKGKSEDAFATIEQLEKTIKEMEDWGIYIYNKKWALEKQVDDAKTIEELQQIVW